MNRKHYIRFFISSTFADMERERNWLAEIFKRIGEEYQREQGWQVEYVDLRWGISEKAGRDNRTMSICKKELQQCQQLSPRPNFIVLVGERYGWIPLPEKVPGNIGRIVCGMTDLFRENYRQDFNDLSYTITPLTPLFGKSQQQANPGTWILKPFDGMDPDQRTNEVEEPLRACFAGLKDGMGFLLGTESILTELYSSATEQEIYYGALSAEDANQHVVGYCRRLRNVPEEFRKIFYDGEDASHQLRSKITGYLDHENLLESEVNYDEYINDDYGKWFTEEMEKRIRKVIDAEIKRTSENEPTLLERELQQQTDYRLRKAGCIVARIEEQQQLRSFAIDERDKSVLWIIGPTGMGKSTLAANVPSLVWANNRNIEERLRSNAFYVRCSLTPLTSTAQGILDLLYAQLFKYYKGQYGNEVPSSMIPALYNAKYEMKKDNLLRHSHLLTNLLARISKRKSRPVVIVLDGLDLLPDKEWELLDRLWTRQNDQYVKFVLVQEKRPYEGRTDVKVDDSLWSFLCLQPFSVSGAKSVLEHVLKSHHRQISTEQNVWITHELGQMKRTGTELTLLGYYLSHFVYSWTPVEQMPAHDENLLIKVTDAIAEQNHHDRHLMWLALSIITTTKGVNDRELIDILSLDEYLQHNFEQTSQHEWKDKRRLPPIFWHRLSHDIADIVGYVNTVYGEVNQVLDNRLANDIWQQCQQMTTPDGSTYAKLAVALQYTYYRNLWQRGNRRAIHDLPLLIYLHYGADSHQGLTELIHLAHDLRFTSKVAALYGTHVAYIFDRIIGFGSKIDASERWALEQLRNWLLDHVGLTSRQILLRALAEADDSPVRLCTNDDETRHSALTNVLRNVAGKDSKVFRPTSYDITPIGLSTDAMRIVYIDKGDLVTFSRQHWSHNVWKSSTAILKTCIDDDARRVGMLFDDNKLAVLELDNLQEVASFTCGDTPVDQIALSHQGHLLAFSCGQYLFIWDIAKQEWICKAPMMEKICSIEFSLTDRTLWVLFSRHVFPYVLDNPGEEAYHISFLDDGKEPAAIIAATDESFIFSRPFLTAVFTMQDGHCMYYSYGALQNRLAGGGVESAVARADGSFTVSMEGLMWDVRDDHLCNPRNAPAFKQLTPDVRFGMTESGIVYNIETAIQNYQVFTGSDEYGILKLGLSTVSACHDGSWMVCTACNDPNREQQIHVASITIDEDDHSNVRIDVPPYSDSYEGRIDTIAAAVTPDGSCCAFTQNGADELRLLLTDRDLQRQRMVVTEKEQLRLQTYAMRSLIWTADSRFLIGAVWHHAFDPAPHLHIFNRQGEYLRSIAYKEDVMVMHDSPVLSPDNRFAARILWGDGLLITDLHSGRHFTALQQSSKHIDDVFAFLPTRNECLATVDGNLYAINCLDGSISERIVCEACGTMLAMSPSGRYVYLKEKGNEEQLVRLDLNSLSKRAYSLKATQVVCTINDQFIYVRTSNNDLLLINADSGDIVQEMYARIADKYMMNTRRGLFVVNTQGTPMLFAPRDMDNVYGTAVAATVLRWNLETGRYDTQPTMVCPHCGRSFPTTVNLRRKTHCPHCHGTILPLNSF